MTAQAGAWPRAARSLHGSPEQETVMTSARFFDDLESRIVFNTSIVIVGSGGMTGGDPTGLNNGNGAVVIVTGGSDGLDKGSGDNQGNGLVTPPGDGGTPTSTGGRINLRGAFRGAVNVLGAG